MRRLFLPVFLCFSALSAAQAADLPLRSVTVAGEGKVEATPDRAVLPITLETKDKALTVAKQKNDALTDKLLKVAAQYGIAKEKLKTSGVMIAPQYRWEQASNKQVFEHYVVSRSLEITIDAMEKSEKLIAAVTEAGVDRVQGLQFTFSDPKALEASARKLAMEDARAKAEALAASAGAKLGPVQTITLAEGGYSAPPPMPMRAMAMKADMAESAPPPLPGLTTIQQHVTVVYALQ